jgi:ATP-dependent helicase HrpB
VRKARDQLLKLAHRGPAGVGAPPCGEALDRALGRLLLTGYPDRVCRRRAPGQDGALMVGGRGLRLAPESGVREAPLFLALSAEAGPRGLHATSLVRLASAVTEEDLRQVFPELIRRRQELVFDEQRRQVLQRRQTCFSDLVLEQHESPPQDPARAAELLAAAAAGDFEALFSPDEEARQLLARLRLAAEHLPGEQWPDVTPEGLRALLPELCHGRRGLDELERLDWAAELGARLTHRQRALLDRELPSRLGVPSGRRAPLDYAAAADSGGLPVLAVKLQELFGLAETPRLARGKLPLLLHLLAPNGRPVQVTRDLRSFWNSGYQEVRRDLRGRYPKHPWPEDPWSARPTARTKGRHSGGRR